MSLPPIKIQVVAGGIAEVLNSIKSIERAQIDSESAVLRIKRSSLKSQLSDLQKFEKSAGEIHRRIASNNGENILRNERRVTDGLLREHKRRSISLQGVLKELGIRNSPNSSVYAGSRMSGGGGGNSGGGISSLLKGFGGESAGAMAAGGIVGGVAVAGVAVVSSALSLLADGIKFGVNEFATAILQIGGGFSVSGAMVKSSVSERKGVELAASLPGVTDPRVIDNMITKLSKGSENTREQWFDAAREYAEKTGEVGGFESAARFIEKHAATSSMSLKDSAALYGRIKKSNSEFTEEDVQATVLGLTGAGQQGTMEVRNFVKGGNTQLISSAGTLEGGMTTQNVMKTVALAENIAASGLDANLATGQARAYISDLSGMGNNKKQRHQLTALGGTFNYGKLGKLDTITENLLIEQQHGRLGNFKGLNRKSKAALGNIATAAHIEAGDSDEEIRKKYKASKAGYESNPETLENMNKKFLSLSDTVDFKLKASFNELNNIIGDLLLPTLKDFATSFAVFLKENSESIKLSAQVLVDLFATLAASISVFSPIIGFVAKTLAGFGIITAKVAQELAKSSNLFGTNDVLIASLGKFVTDLSALSDSITGFGTPKSEKPPKPESGNDVPKPASAIDSIVSGIATGAFMGIERGSSSQVLEGLPDLSHSGINMGIPSLLPDPNVVALEAAKLQLKAAEINKATADKTSRLPTNGKPTDQQGHHN